MQELSMRMLWYIHQSWSGMTFMLWSCALSRSSRFVTLPCHLIPDIKQSSHGKTLELLHVFSVIYSHRKTSTDNCVLH